MTNDIANVESSGDEHECSGGRNGECGRLLIKNVDQVRLGEEWPTPHGQGDEEN
jgi:hypothetical protein